MNILFVADPLEVFKIYKDTTFSMMREAQRRGHRIAACEPRHLTWRSGGVVQAEIRQVTLTGEEDWFRVDETSGRAVKDFDAVIMRKDPPFDDEYFYATHMLEQAQREGAKVFNRPASPSWAPSAAAWRRRSRKNLTARPPLSRSSSRCRAS